MDDFREWLSDNLRYFELGGIILLIVLVLVFGIRSCLSRRSQSSGTTSSSEQKSGKNKSEDDDVVSMDSTDGSSDNPLVEADEQIAALIAKYYEGLNARSISAVREVVDGLLASEEPLISNSAYENYVVDKVYTKNGLDEDSKVVYVTFTRQRVGIATPIPVASWLYVTKNANGEWKIMGTSSEDTQIDQYMKSLSEDKDVKDLIDSVTKAYNETIAANPELADSEDSSEEGSENGTQMRATTGVNVRSAPSTDGDVLGELSEGDTVTKTGEDGSWVQITYNGQTAYVYGEYLRAVE